MPRLALLKEHECEQVYPRLDYCLTKEKIANPEVIKPEFMELVDCVICQGIVRNGR